MYLNLLSLVPVMIVYCWLDFYICPGSSSSGYEGCHNVRRGGDTVKGIDSGPYLTYVVYKSFKRPSSQVKSLARSM